MTKPLTHWGRGGKHTPCGKQASRVYHAPTELFQSAPVRCPDCWRMFEVMTVEGLERMGRTVQGLPGYPLGKETKP